MIIMFGLSHKKCGDGSSGMTVAMFCWLTRLRLAGTTCQTEVLTQKRTQDTVNSIQNMYITTTFTLTLMRSLELQEVPLVRTLVVSYQEVNSMMRADGDLSLSVLLFKRTLFKQISQVD